MIKEVVNDQVPFRDVKSVAPELSGGAFAFVCDKLEAPPPIEREFVFDPAFRFDIAASGKRQNNRTGKVNYFFHKFT